MDSEHCHVYQSGSLFTCFDLVVVMFSKRGEEEKKNEKVWVNNI